MDVSDIFYFFCLGEGKGESGATGRGGGSVFLLKIPEGGGASPTRGGGRDGVGRVFAGNWGGGAKYFFFGAEMPAKEIEGTNIQLHYVKSCVKTYLGAFNYNYVTSNMMS